MKKPLFGIDEELYDKIENFKASHKECKHGAIFDQFEYKIVPTGIGYFIDVKCLACKDEMRIDGDGNITYLSKEDIEKDKLREKIYTESRDLYTKKYETTGVNVGLMSFLGALNYFVKFGGGMAMYKLEGLECLVDYVKKNQEQLSKKRHEYINERMNQRAKEIEEKFNKKVQ